MDSSTEKIMSTDAILPGRIRTPVGSDKSRTRQSHAKDCDINQIMAKFQRTGSIDHVATHGARYANIESIDYHTAMNLTRDAEQMFDDLPSSLRKKFENLPGNFMDFVQDPDNLEEMDTLGLLNDEASQRLQAQREAANAAPPTPEPPPAEPATPPE